MKHEGSAGCLFNHFTLYLEDAPCPFCFECTPPPVHVLTVAAMSCGSAGLSLSSNIKQSNASTPRCHTTGANGDQGHRERKHASFGSPHAQGHYVSRVKAIIIPAGKTEDVTVTVNYNSSRWLS
ncbi:hypothetical protein GW17_00061598 [Ensete ventricosum]|nr:hypothetical protein GW17_00061598 [Ensete ventricosum]RZR99372.1 hypothetical protein BHM03_00028907 [Ensete ventricosum]